jgi:C-terminal processing protease CtpA/Prc
LLAVLAVGPHRCEQFAGRMEIVTYLGVEVRTSASVVDEDGETGPGAYVVSVFPHSPALSAQLAPGDVIIALSGDSILTSGDLVRAVRARQPGEVVTLRVLRSTGEVALLRAELSSIERWRIAGGLPGGMDRKLNSRGPHGSEN